MEKYIISKTLGVCVIGGCVLGLLFFSACGNYRPYVQVLQGNYAYTRGEYEEANLRYLQSLEYDEHRDVISYNLGNVYYALGENMAAIEEWDKARKSDDPNLLSRVEYNKGVLYYEISRYEDAYQAFKNSLRLKPQDKAAKINLEYSLQKLNVKTKPPDRTQDHDEIIEASADIERVLEIIRRKEEELLEQRVLTASPERDAKDW